MIDQITVFLENEEGRLAALCRTIADAGINMHALTIADTSDYGVARIICDNPAKAADVLKRAEYSVNVTKVAAIAVPDRPGGLAELLDTLNDAGVNIEYGYCFGSKSDYAIDILKVHGGDKVIEKLDAAGFKALQPADVYAPDAL